MRILQRLRKHLGLYWWLVLNTPLSWFWVYDAFKWLSNGFCDKVGSVTFGMCIIYINMSPDTKCSADADSMLRIVQMWCRSGLQCILLITILTDNVPPDWEAMRMLFYEQNRGWNPLYNWMPKIPPPPLRTEIFSSAGELNKEGGGGGEKRYISNSKTQL